MAYTAAVLDSQIDVSDIRDLLVQGDTAFPTINFTLPAGFTGLTWRVRGTFMQFNLATQSEELAVTGSTTISVAWPVGSNFTTYYGEMQIVLVGTDALGNLITKATGYINVQRDYSISTVELVDENLFEQLMAELANSALLLDQTTPQTFVGGIPKLAADRVIDHDNELADKKYVDDHTPPTPVHNDLGGLQGGTTGEYYHTTQAQNAALHSHANKTALDAVRGTNTGDQDVSGAISTHNTDAGAHAVLARKSTTMQLLISRTIVAGENVSAITWTQDDAGNALSLIEAEISAIVPPNTLSVGSTAYLRMRLNDKFGSTDYQLGSSLSSLIYLSVFRSLRGASTLRIKQIQERIFCKTDYLFSDGTTHNAGTYTSVTTFDSTAINKIYIDVSGLTYFPNGTKIEIYGRTA